jgi:hypothetical protein
MRRAVTHEQRAQRILDILRRADSPLTKRDLRDQGAGQSKVLRPTLARMVADGDLVLTEVRKGGLTHTAYAAARGTTEPSKTPRGRFSSIDDSVYEGRILDAIAAYADPVPIYRLRYKAQIDYPTIKRLLAKLASEGRVHTEERKNHGNLVTYYSVPVPRNCPDPATLPDLVQMVADLSQAVEDLRVRVELFARSITEDAATSSTLRGSFDRYSRLTGKDLKSIVYEEFLPLLIELGGGTSPILRGTLDPTGVGVNGSRERQR